MQANVSCTNIQSLPLLVPSCPFCMKAHSLEICDPFSVLLLLKGMVVAPPEVGISSF
jgi:hypothetical protein